MCKSISLSIILALFMSVNLIGQSKSSGTITGTGDIVKKEISLSSFESLNLGIGGTVILTQGSSQKVVIEGQQNIIDNISQEVKGGSWRIRFIKNVKEAKPVTVHITVPMINEIGLAGSGNIRSSGAFSNIDKLELSVAGSGDISFEYQANETDVNLSGSGEVHLSGDTKKLVINISGSGDVFAEKLMASGCEVNISGSGNARIKVNGDLRTNIAGSGGVKYTGDANVMSRISGSGNVGKL